MLEGIMGWNATHTPTTRSFTSVLASAAATAVSRISTAIDHIGRWMNANRLRLNASKTQFIWLGTRQQLARINISNIQLHSAVVHIDDVVKDLGILLDGTLSMEDQVSSICKSCFFQLGLLRNHCLPQDYKEQIVHAFMYSRLDFGNSLLYDITDN